MHYRIFCFRFMDFDNINIQKTICSIIKKFKQTCSLKVMAYSFYIIYVLLSILCIGPLTRINKSYFLLSTRQDEFISTPNIITLLPNPLPLDQEKVPFTTNLFPIPECLFLSKSALLINLTAPSKGFPNFKSEFRLNIRKSILYTI